MRLILFIAFLSSLSLSVSQAFADDSADVVSFGTRLVIESAILEESREIWVSTPYGYENSEETYPVLLLLDGITHFQHASTSAVHLARSNRIPGLIVVGLLSTDRGRDFTPPTTDPDEATEMESHGGADRFLEFLTQELLPEVDAQYRTRPHRILAGHSLGGLFATHTLVTSPDSFAGYIILSPSLDWSNQGLVDQTEDMLANTAELQADIYFSVANEGGETLGALRKITGMLGENTPRGLRWNFRHMPLEHHNSMTLTSLYFGLEAVFEGWSVPDYFSVYEVGGLESLERVYRDGGRRFGYDRELSSLTKLQLADDLITLNRIEEADAIVTGELDARPPAYFVNLLGEKYEASGNSERAIELYTLSLSSNPADAIAARRLAELGVDTSSLISTASVASELLQLYTGTYEPMPNVSLSIYMEDARLYSQVQGQRATELIPTSETRFSLRDADAEIEFIAEESQPASRLIIHQFGQEIVADRVE